MRYIFFFQAEDGIRDLVRSRGLGDVYKRLVVDTFSPEERSILADMHEDLCDLLAYTAAELRPQLRLAASDRRASKSLGR